MKNLLACCAALHCLALGGCTATTPGIGQETGNTGLPSGLRLLGSDERQCEGTVQVGDESLAGDGLGADFFVEPGQNATFEFRDRGEDVEWACDGGASRDIERMSCPEGATHVRITRASVGDELLLECYG